MAKQTFTTGQVLTAAQMTSLQQTAMGGGSATAKTASYTLVAADAGTTVIMNSGSATTITVNTALFAAGDTVFIVNQGAGVCTITAGTATVTTAGSLAMGANETGQLYFLSASAAIFSEYTQSASTSGGMTLLSTTTLSGSTTTISSIDQTYINLFLEINNVNPSVDNTVEIKPNNTANLCYGVGLYNFGGTIGFESAGTNGNVPIAYYDASNTNNQYSMNINNYTSTTSYKSIEWYGSYMHGSGTQIGNIRAGGILTNSAITSLVFITTGGTFNGGTIKLYGVK
jgi:hypothetical protein